MTNNIHPRIEYPIIDLNTKKIAYIVTDSDLSFTEYWIMDIDGSSNAKIADLPYIISNHQFYQSGSKLVYSIANGQIYTMNIDGTEKTQITSEGINDLFALSPDETLLVISSLRENTRKLYSINIDGSNLNMITNLDYSSTQRCREAKKRISIS